MFDYPRFVIKFSNGVVLSVVHLFPGTKQPYETLIIDGSDEIIDELCEQLGEHISDTLRFDGLSLARWITTLQHECLGIQEIVFDQKELERN